MCSSKEWNRILATTRNWRKQGMDFSLQLSEGAWPHWHLDCPSGTDSRLLVPRMVREYVSVFLSHQVCGNLLWRLQETSTVQLAFLLATWYLLNSILHGFITTGNGIQWWTLCYGREYNLMVNSMGSKAKETTWVWILISSPTSYYSKLLVDWWRAVMENIFTVSDTY